MQFTSGLSTSSGEAINAVELQQKGFEIDLDESRTHIQYVAKGPTGLVLQADGKSWLPGGQGTPFTTPGVYEAGVLVERSVADPLTVAAWLARSTYPGSGAR